MGAMLCITPISLQAEYDALDDPITELNSYTLQEVFTDVLHPLNEYIIHDGSGFDILTYPFDDLGGHTLNEIYSADPISPVDMMDQTNAQRETQFNADEVDYLSLTNLIQNGQFTSDSNSDGLADYWLKSDTATLNNGIQYITSSGSQGFLYVLSNITVGQNYYMYLDYITTESGYYYNITTMGQETFQTGVGSGKYSIVMQANNNPGTFPVFYNVAEYSIGVDNVSLFNSSTYTKTQIDTALTNFGYLPYNITYSLPDSTDADFTDRYVIYAGDSPSNTTLYSITTLQDSGLFGTMSVAEIKTQIADFHVNGITDANTPYFINYDQFGLSLTKAEIDLWYSIYDGSYYPAGTVDFDTKTLYFHESGSVYNIGGMITDDIYSDMYNKGFAELNTIQRLAQRDQWALRNYNELYVLSFTDYQFYDFDGTVADMIGWYNLYLSIIDANRLESETVSDNELIILIIALVLFLIGVVLGIKFKNRILFFASGLLFFIPIFIVDNVFIIIFSAIMILSGGIMAFYDPAEKEYE